MASGNYDIDKIFWPITLTKSNDALVVSEDGGVRESLVRFSVDSDIVTFPATLYNHKDTTFAAGASVSHFALLHQLEAALNNNTTLQNTYSVTANTPTGSDLTNSGITIARASGTNQFNLEWAGASTTVDPRWFGWPAGASDTGLGTSHDSPGSIWAVWQSPVVAHDKRRRPTQVASRSDGSAHAKSVIWDSPLRRQVTWQPVRGAHVWNDRADDATLASEAGLPTGDTRNALQDLWWESARAGDVLLFAPNDGAADWQIGSGFEWVTLQQQWRDDFFGAWLTDMAGGEKYSVTVGLDADRDNSEYSH